MSRVRTSFRVRCGLSTAVAALSCLGLGAGLTSICGAAEALTAAQLWAQFIKTPQTHRHIPDFSYAGYRYGESPLPQPRVVANVRESGAKADGKTDDTESFRRAIDAAKKAGGGAILVPAGTYRLDGTIRLDASDLVLRGEGQDKTVLQFERPLDRAIGPFRSGRSSRWAWSGGLVWVGPQGTFDADGKVARTKPGWEDWYDNRELGEVIQPAPQGATVVEVLPAAAGKLTPGQSVLLCWSDPPDHSLLREIAGNPSMAKAEWDGLAGIVWRWPVEVVKVEGGRVTIRQPLRLPVRPEWKVRLQSLGPHVRESGVESLTIRFPAHAQAKHLQDPGYNGVFLNNAVHCWVRHVTVEHCDNGILVSACKNCTVAEFRIAGGSNHHATFGGRSHDCLYENFRIESKPQHGINTEGLASGNVWRNGEMLNGTFDSHCGMSFDLLRENIRLNNTGNPGGAGNAGPFLGRRVVHWNIQLTGGTSEWCFGPAYLPDGAIVGGTGGALFTRDAKLWHMPEGPKGCVVAEFGVVVEPPSLFQAQRRFRAVGR